MNRYILILTLAVLVINSAPAAHGFIVNGADKTLDVPAYRIRGAEYLPLTLICDAYSINWEWDPVARTAELTKGNAKLRVKVDEYRVYTNGVISIQERPVIFYNGAVCVPSDFLRTLFNKFFLAGPARPFSAGTQKERERHPAISFRYKIRRVILDAGHGGYDPGAIGRGGMKEKHIVLDITRAVKGLLEREGIEVVLTRGRDEFVPLWERSAIANEKGADLFISIHANASRTKRLKGFEVYCLSEAIDDNDRAIVASEKYALNVDRNSIYGQTDVLEAILWDLELTENRKNSIELARCILGEVDTSREKIKSARFFVLKSAMMPAVLVEVGYITNKDEGTQLREPEYRTKIAQQIAEGILNYKREFDTSDGFSN